MTDVVVVGAGHNGLVCAAYLARAGLDVVVVEARAEVGGCASTVDAFGARVNVCNCDHTLIRATGIIDDLDLAAHGLRYIDLEPSMLAVVEGEQPWFQYHDVEDTFASLAATHPSQVDGYRRYLAAAMPVTRLVQQLAAEPPRVRSVLRRAAAAPALARLAAWSRQSAEAVLRKFFTSEALVAPAIAAGPAVWGVRPSTPGTGLGALIYATRHLVQVGRPVGGSGALPAALASAVRGAGGTIRTGAAVATIVCDGPAVSGVVLAGGETVSTPVVVSTVAPRTTLVTWLARPPAAAAALCDRWRVAPEVEGYEAKIDAVVDHLPRYRGVDPERAWTATAVVTPDVAGITAARDAADAGRVGERPLFLANVPSVPDPSVAPGDGGHVFSLEVLFTPYAIPSGEPERWLSTYASLLEPGFLEGVRHWRVTGPEDYERDFHLVRGHAPSFSGGPLAALMGKAPELTRYETPVRGLYLSGAGTFPGAGVWGASGRNAAHVVLRRLGA